MCKDCVALAECSFHLPSTVYGVFLLKNSEGTKSSPFLRGFCAFIELFHQQLSAVFFFFFNRSQATFFVKTMIKQEKQKAVM